MKVLQLILTLCVFLLASNFLAQSVSAQPCCDTPGDANGDGDANVGDAVYLINYVFKSGPEPLCMEEGDANGDTQVNVGDAVYLINFVFKNGPAPVCLSLSDVIFDDEYGSGVTYEAFDGSFFEAVQVSADSFYAGTQGLEVFIPGADPWWSGGAFTDSTERDLSGYNALTFWAKASQEATLDVMGIGNDNTGTSEYMAEMSGIALTTDWQQFVIPFPLPEKLTAERGLFYFAEGEGVEYQIWIDEIVFDSLTTITNPRPALTTETIEVEVGAAVNPSNGTVTFDVDGTDMVLSIMPGYFTFSTSDPAVVSVGGDGTLTAVGEGTATLTADLGSVSATGEITVNVTSPVPEPTTPAPAPTVSEDSVISLFSDVYTDHPVDRWSTDWDNANVEDYLIGSDSTKKYTNLVFAGIEFYETATVDATEMTHFHMDVWTPDATASPAVFKVKLVDAGPDGDITTTGDNVEHELTFDENTMSSETWVSIDVPLASFTGLVTKAHLAQMIISGDPNTVYVDNVYFYNSGLPEAPEVPAPTPTESNVISLYSDAYTDHPVLTWSAPWDVADVEDFVIGTDSTKKYTNVVYAGIDFTSPPIDATTMTHFHMDVWTPLPTDAPAVFKVKLVDGGPDGVIGTGGDDVEVELSFDETTMNTGTWVSIDIPLSDFTGLSTGALGQMVLSGDLSTFFVDNIYFYAPAPTEPTSSAPTPTPAEADVFSVFSDIYTNTEFDTWSSQYDDADFAYFAIGSDSMVHYSNIVYTIAEYTSSGTADLSAMTHFHIDVWTPDNTGASDTLKIKLVDFGANGVYDYPTPIDDVEGELAFGNSTMSTGSWVSLDIPLADFDAAGMTTKAHFAQMIISGTYGTVFIDNVYFHK